MFTRKNLIRLLFVGLLLAMLAVPIVGTALENQLATTDSDQFSLIQSGTLETGTAIACNCPDPGGSGGTCC